MSKLRTLEEMQLLVDTIDKCTQSQIQELVECFWFAAMIDINILNHDLLRIHILFLHKLSKHDVFYKSFKPTKHSLAFILSNLRILKDFQLPEISAALLNLLKHLLHKAKDFNHLTEMLQLKRDKIFDVLMVTLKLETFNISHVSDFMSVLYDLLQIDGFLCESQSKNLAEIIDTFTKFNVIYEVAVISEVVLEKYALVSEMFAVCSLWLLTQGTELLLMSNDEHFILKVMEVLNNFYVKYDSGFNKQIVKNIKLNNAIGYCMELLSKHSEIIISFFTKETLRENSTKLFAFILTNQALVKDWNICYRKLVQLPADPSEWVNSEPDLFLRICYLLCLNNRIMWTPSKIIQVINTLLYSYQRFVLKTDLLKIICYVYSFVLPVCIDKLNVLLGDDLIIVISRRYYELEEIFSLHICELNWILRRGENALKKAMVCFWLNSDGDPDVLKRCILSCKSQNVLINIVLDPHLKEDNCLKAAELIRNMQDPYLSKKIAKMLPLAYNAPKLFNRLIMSKPDIPEDKQVAMMLCEFMSIVLVITIDEDIFGLACDYSKELVTHLKTDVDVVSVFCKDYRNILFILRRLQKLKDDAAIKTLGLLKVLLLVQKRNHSSVDTTIEADIGYALSGNTCKLGKCLDVIHLLTTQRLFINLSPESIQSIFLKLFTLCQNTELSAKSLICLTEILKVNNWLATLSTTNLFVETNCSLAVNDDTWPEFIVFLATWLKILKKYTGDLKFYIAHFGIIRNYIKRIPGLRTKKVNYFLKIIRELEAMKSNTSMSMKIVMNEFKQELI